MAKNQFIHIVGGPHCGGKFECPANPHEMLKCNSKKDGYDVLYNLKKVGEELRYFFAGWRPKNKTTTVKKKN